MTMPATSPDAHLAALMGRIDALEQLVLALAVASPHREAFVELLTTKAGHFQSSCHTSSSEVAYAAAFADVRNLLMMVVDVRMLAEGMNAEAHKPLQ